MTRITFSTSVDDERTESGSMQGVSGGDGLTGGEVLVTEMEGFGHGAEVVSGSRW